MTYLEKFWEQAMAGWADDECVGPNAGDEDYLFFLLPEDFVDFPELSTRSVKNTRALRIRFSLEGKVFEVEQDGRELSGTSAMIEHITPFDRGKTAALEGRFPSELTVEYLKGYTAGLEARGDG